MTGERRPSRDELVTVVIPAYNAEATIDETLRSVRAQTHRQLEIIVVDDGSQDGTFQIAENHAAIDPRVQVVRQSNAGVAAARNLGWQRGTGAIFAFVDGDDLWSADKTERQLAALHAAPDAELVYSWSVVIDAESRIIQQWDGPLWQGDVLRQLMLGNFIGNGSATMVTRRALQDADGFEPALRAADAGGCEDILFYSRVAERHRFALAPGYLIGYRYLGTSMSSDLARMLRSWIMVHDELLTRHRDKQAELDQGLDAFARWLVRRAIAVPWQLPGPLAIVARRSLSQAMAILCSELPLALADFARRSRRNAVRTGSAADRFEIGTPKLCREAELSPHAKNLECAPAKLLIAKKGVGRWQGGFRSR